ncbi:MAG: hypothetical protein NW200_09480 [Hyphomonadaceae bacterium]|nr:hypothetical protein [Hyphomonadaceae bacterium]
MARSTRIADTADLVAATEWARRVYGALRDWDVARRGRWSTWDDGSILLTVETTPDGAPCAPVTIAAVADRIAFHTRDWEADVPMPGQSFEAAVESVRSLGRLWFSGGMKLAAFYQGDQRRGALAIDPARLEEELTRGLAWIAAQAVVDRVEIQGPRPDLDERFGLAVDGRPLAPPN